MQAYGGGDNGSDPPDGRYNDPRKSAEYYPVRDEEDDEEDDEPVTKKSKWSRAMCDHNMRLTRCRQGCKGGGVAYCTHGREKWAKCPNCGPIPSAEKDPWNFGTSIIAMLSDVYPPGSWVPCLPHGIKLAFCKLCPDGGAALCAHGYRYGRECIKCDPDYVCKKRVRGKRTYVRIMCVCGKRLATCVKCGGSGLCSHGRHKHRCKDCNAAKTE